MRSRVLVVSNFFPPRTVGGAEIVAFRQALALTSRGHEVTVLAGDLPTSDAPAGTFSFERYMGLPVYRLALRSLDADENFFWPAAARRMTAILAADQIETVHFHNIMGLGANLIPVAKEFGARCVVTLHDHWGFCLRQTRLRPDGSLCNQFDECAKCLPAIQPPGGTALPIRLRRDYVSWCLSHADWLISPSAYLATAYAEAGFAPERILVISNGIDLETIEVSTGQRDSDGPVKFLCSAYLGEHKGIPVLLDAIRRLAADPSITAPWEVTIAGEGHLRSVIESALKSEAVSQHLRFIGRVPRSELMSHMRETDVAVLASIWPENEPVTMLEAIASGAAQIATRTGGNLELVDEGKSGLLVAPGDARALADAMKQYIQDRTLAARHGAYNHARHKRFDEATSIDRIEQVYAAQQRPVAANPESQPVVICGTGWPALEVGALTSHLHEHLGDGLMPRLVWREWADATVWREAALLWLWDRHAEEWLVNTALRRGVPVLAAANPWAEGLARHYGGVILYHTYLEAFAAMRTLLAMPALRQGFAGRALAGAEAATALVPSTAFSLKSEAGS